MHPLACDHGKFLIVPSGTLPFRLGMDSNVLPSSKGVLQFPIGSIGSCNVTDWIQVEACTVTAAGSCPSCHNGVRDGSESDIDCGGTSTCSRCEGGWFCSSHSDCASGYECGIGNSCVGKAP